MIIREHYLNKIRGFYDSDLIKIITGIRRSGKSIILNQVIDEIKQKSNNIIYLNFEDKKTLNMIDSADKLIEYVNNNKKEGKCYIFLDEIQLLDKWALACKTLRLNKNSVFITGSNSKLLSSEFAKELSGRYVSFRVRPFIYKEIVEYCNQLGKQANIIDYIIWGGFPNRFEFNSEEQQRIYLSNLEDTIVINDLISRYKIKKINLFKSIVNYVLKSNSRIISAKSIHKYIKNTENKCSINTIINYLEYLKEAYIINEIKPYSSRTKEQLKYYYKIYNEDVSFNSLSCIDNRYDLSHNLENIIYNELIFMDYEVSVFNNDNSEVDFLAQKNGKKYYIQVAYSVEDYKAYEREFKVLNKLENENKKILITTDEIDYSTTTVTHIKLKDFLLLDSLDNI